MARLSTCSAGSMAFSSISCSIASSHPGAGCEAWPCEAWPWAETSESRVLVVGHWSQSPRMRRRRVSPIRIPLNMGRLCALCHSRRRGASS